MREGEVALLRRLFMTHPSQVGSASQLTLLRRDVAGLVKLWRGFHSGPIRLQKPAICEVLARDSRYHRLCNLDSPITCQQMCHLIPWLPLATSCT